MDKIKEKEIDSLDCNIEFQVSGYKLFQLWKNGIKRPQNKWVSSKGKKKYLMR